MSGAAARTGVINRKEIKRIENTACMVGWTQTRMEIMM